MILPLKEVVKISAKRIAFMKYPNALMMDPRSRMDNRNRIVPGGVYDAQHIAPSRSQMVINNLFPLTIENAIPSHS